jgi:hypothetical protein
MVSKDERLSDQGAKKKNYEWGSVGEEDLMMYSEQTASSRYSSLHKSRLSRDRMSIAMEDFMISNDERLSDKGAKKNNSSPRNVIDGSPQTDSSLSPKSQSTIPNSPVFSS